MNRDPPSSRAGQYALAFFSSPSPLLLLFYEESLVLPCEEEQHRASNHANIACKKAIETAIASHYHDNRLDAETAVRDVVKQFGFERMLYVLANTTQNMEHDGRVSRANKDWA